MGYGFPGKVSGCGGLPETPTANIMHSVERFQEAPTEPGSSLPLPFYKQATPTELIGRWRRGLH